MALKLFNTLTKTKEEFKPMTGNDINFFVCGPTVYDFPHLGHAKTYTQFDFIVRYLRYTGYNVFYLQNITDIDDKIIERAKKNNIDWKELAIGFEKIYKEDMETLGNTAVSEYARATDYISEIIKQVEELMQKGYAYKIDDGIYFEVAKFPEYGKLSGRTALKEDDAVSRIDESVGKRGWNDFCLWKAEKPGEPAWESGLGRGRPGWHIEDTAITATEFGPQYDVHGGAVDLIFPHHECEITQMEAASGLKPFVKYWLHTGFLNIDSKKMSKSKGNFKTIRDVLKEYDFRTIRYFILSGHYRTMMDFSVESLDQARNSLERINNFVENINPTLDDSDNEKAVLETKNEILEALDDDFNTAEALAALFEFIRMQNSKGKNGKNVLNLFIELNKIFGDIFLIEKKEIPAEVLKLAGERETARQAGDFKKSDELRDQIKKLGFEIKDTPDGYKLSKIS